MVASLLPRPKEKDPMLLAEEESITSKSSKIGCCVWKVISSELGNIIKLHVIICVTILHLVYTYGLLDMFKVYEMLVFEVSNVTRTAANERDIREVVFVMRELIDYKKNMWMSVGALSASLSCSLFLVSRLGEKNINNLVNRIMRLCDFLFYVFLLVLTAERHFLTSILVNDIPKAMAASEKLVDPSNFMNKLNCSMQVREGMSTCAETMIVALWPVLILKYLVILVILTAAYIGLAYLIEWCIRHYFPPTKNTMVACSRRPSPTHSYKQLDAAVLVRTV